MRDGEWQVLDCTSAGDGNCTSDCFVAFAWQGPGDVRLLVSVNYAPNQSQCYVRLPYSDLDKSQWRLKDLMSDATYELYLDEPAWRARVLSLTRARGS